MRKSLRKARSIFVRDVRLAYSYVLTFWTNFLGTAGQAITFYFVAKLVAPTASFGTAGHAMSYFEYVAVNLAFMRFQSAATTSFQRAVRNDQMMGTTEALMVTPTELPLMIASAGLWPFALAAIQIVVFLAVSMPLGLHLDHVDGVSLTAFTILTVLVMSPLGILAGAGIMSFKQELPTGLLVGGLASLLGGVLFPISKLPEALQRVAWLLPITHSLNGVRGAVVGASLWQLRADAVWLLVVSLVLVPLSLYVFARAVRRTKIDGTLGDY
ncbi:MAG: ABC transporter permease [Candidatus Eremiobacteraeota bacterium]|nr:ABC transporter permease [Candidatus Eremiobacteraeota bacterium]